MDDRINVRSRLLKHKKTITMKSAVTAD